MSTDVKEYERIGHADGLSAGLAKVLDGVDVDAVAPGRFAAVPERRAGDAAVVAHSLAAREGVTFVRCAGDNTAGAGEATLVGQRLAGVRLGLTRRLLELAVEHLTGRVAGGEELIRKQLNVGAIADVLCAVETLRRYVEVAPPEALADIHEQITAADWDVIKLFAASGYIADHPVRALYVSELVANTWVSKGAGS
jgi:hypothetical protein